ncbi:hypothetical protein [Acidithiobacillus sp. AMEEHan]|uniref:hypothetical protein n=1 Tax=Acidithiobacillus sp. AMEEHan TaxID=2994951 RepID=UPI0027E4A05A|nr:hypothetical protein [Acidithiobacillus sp. AMEEHan]
MNIKQHPAAIRPAATPPTDLQQALEALEEKQDLVQEKLRELLGSIDHAHPDEIMDQVLILDRELRKYRRFFHILKSHFIDQRTSAN